MLHVSPDSVVLAACWAALWFININPVMSVVIRAQAFQWFLLPRQSRLGQANRDFWTSVVEIIGTTLDVKAKFKSRRKNA
jgi:hypothetical protein